MLVWDLSLVQRLFIRHAELQREHILKENKGKSGIYLWTNTLNGKSYVGSSVNLNFRFNHYYSKGYLKKEMDKNNSTIYKALLKNGYSNFRLEIIEYCEPEKCIEREQYFIDLLNPQYNCRFTTWSETYRGNSG